MDVHNNLYSAAELEPGFTNGAGADFYKQLTRLLNIKNWHRSRRYFKGPEPEQTKIKSQDRRFYLDRTQGYGRQCVGGEAEAPLGQLPTRIHLTLLVLIIQNFGVEDPSRYDFLSGSRVGKRFRPDPEHWTKHFHNIFHSFFLSSYFSSVSWRSKHLEGSSYCLKLRQKRSTAQP